MAMWEFAPGSPWNTIFFALLMVFASPGALYQPLSF